jgi:hypothetical protein
MVTARRMRPNGNVKIYYSGRCPGRPRVAPS